MTADLIEFLRARLDDDERIAQAATSGAWIPIGNSIGAEVNGCTCGTGGHPYGGLHEQYCGLEGPVVQAAAVDVEHIARHDLARVLREVAAKRAIIDRHALLKSNSHLPDWCDECDSEFPCHTLLTLAEIHSDHPDYRQRTEWA